MFNKLNALSEKELHKLLDLMGIGIMNGPEDKDELILILSIEPERKIISAINELKKKSVNFKLPLFLGL